MAEQSETPGPPPVSDHRPVPRGVLPRGFQTWLMAGLALGIVLIILIAGQPEPPAAPAQMATAPLAPNPDRLRDYQERLRAMEARQAQEAQATAPPATMQQPVVEASAPAPEDPIVADRKRREYESLFASNVVLSRRPEAERPDTGVGSGAASSAREPVSSDLPSLQEVADAVVRATGRQNVGPPSAPTTGSESQPSADSRPATATTARDRTPDRTAAISAAGPLHPLLEGTVIDTVLTNRLDGGGTAPVNCLVTNPVYSHSGQHILIPAGARILGETRPVQALGETRLAVAFHRVLMPDGSTQRLDQFLGLNQIGDAGLRDKVNHHYWSMFGAAAAVGLISGLAQWIGTAGFTDGPGDRTVIIAGGADAASQAYVIGRTRTTLVTLTGDGREVLERGRRSRSGDSRQEFYVGVRKPRELAHDSRVYAAYARAADRLTGRGDRVHRVVLEEELKREYQRFLQAENRARRECGGGPEDREHAIARWAQEHELPYEDGHVQLPDARIEYEDRDGRRAVENIEVVTPHYRGAHAAAKARSGFTRYRAFGARVGGLRTIGRSGRGVDPRLAEELLS